MESKILYYLDEIDRLCRGEYVVPSTCEIDPSNNCMLSCSFCLYAKHLSQNHSDLSWETYKNTVIELHEIGVKSITFTGGGEPLMNPMFNDMAEYAFVMGFEIGLVTNGVLLDRVEWPEKYTFIRVSIDAGSNEVYRLVKEKNYFDKVVSNIMQTIKRGATVGLSYVVCPENVNDIERASSLANDLGVAYIQFKPAWLNGNPFDNFNPILGKHVIETRRYQPSDNLPCTIAGLIGIVGADENVYYCCQHRGNPEYNLGSLKNRSFSEIWSQRMNVRPEFWKCPRCRYMNYAKAYSDATKKGTLFFKHKNFL